LAAAAVAEVAAVMEAGWAAGAEGAVAAVGVAEELHNGAAGKGLRDDPLLLPTCVQLSHTC
jgi:hypothetical protein